MPKSSSVTRPKGAKVVHALPKPVKYRVAVPGSKSYINRALMCAALARGKTVITNPNYCDDVKALIQALRKLGVRITDYADKIEVYGKGGKFEKPKGKLNMGNAGTATRFILPHVPAGSIVTGNHYMQKRPVQDLLDALEQIGYQFTSPTGCPPVKVHSKDIVGNELIISGNLSSQYISSLLMLAPTLPNGLTIHIKGKLVSQPYIDMTLSVMKQFGIRVTNRSYKTFVVKPQKYVATSYDTPGDASSATYWWVLAAVTRSHITVTNVSARSEQADVGLLKVLENMGCTVHSDKHTSTVVGPLQLKPVKVNMGAMPDAVMSLAMAAAVADGTTTITNVHHLVVKETNRLKVLVENLKRVGVKTSATKDALTIHGNSTLASPAKPGGRSRVIHTHDDHRFAMAFAVLGARVGNMIIDIPWCVRKSYPNFWKDGQTMLRETKPQNIVLTGMRASGKSTVAKQWAKQFKMRYVDLDNEIEKSVGMPITQYVAQNGWKAFRQVEHDVTVQAAQRKNTIIATGGGTMMFPRNVALLNSGYIILLYAPVQELQRRIRADIRTAGQRPALHTSNQAPTNSSTVSEVAAVWRERKVKYVKIADTVYDSRHLS